jgi:uncharacterized protein
MKKGARRGLVVVGVLALAAYATPLVYLKANERRLVFHPEAVGGRTVAPLPDSLHLIAERVQFATADSVRIAAVVIPVADTAAQWLLYFHGNGGNVTSSDRPLFYARWHALGLNVLAVDYRGYGESGDQQPSETGTYADARAAYEWLRAIRKVPADRIIIYGHSLGTGVATELALHVQAAGLILEGAFTSVPDVGQMLYPYLPVRLLATQRFANLEKIGRVAMPKLIMHASDDEEIPYAQGQKLFAAANAPKDWVELKGGHMRAFLDDSAHFWGHTRSFVERLRNDMPAAESPPPGRP